MIGIDDNNEPIPDSLFAKTPNKVVRIPTG